MHGVDFSVESENNFSILVMVILFSGIASISTIQLAAILLPN